MSRRAVAAVAATVLALAVGACGLGSTGLGRAADQPFTADIGCDEPSRAVLEQWAERGLGASIVDLGGDRACVAAVGLADPETGRPNTPDTVYSIGSITKAVTAVAIVDLVDQGVLTLDDPAGAHVEGLTGAAAEATVRQLLLHTSGLTGAHGADHVPLGAREAIASISGLDQSFPAGTDYQYTNANYTLLGLIIEAVTDRGFRRYLAEEIMVDRAGDPLGGFWDGQPEPAGPRAWGYFSNGEDLQLASQRGRAPGPHWAMDGNGLIAMTPLELAEWTWALFNGRILSADGLERLLTTTTLLAGDRELPGWAELPASRFGEPILVTSGGGGSIGHQMTVAWFTRSGRVVVVAEHASDYDLGSFIGDSADALVAGTGLPGPRLVPEAAPGVVEAAAGTYRLGEAELELTARDGGLLVRSRGAEAVRALYPVPAGAAELLARHERQAVDFVEGRTAEGRRERERLEAANGPLVSADVVATISRGELVTFVETTYERGSTLLGVALDPSGGTQALGYDEWPDAWFVAADAADGGDGAFVEFLAGPENELVVLRPTERGLVIEAAAGTVVAERTD